MLESPNGATPGSEAETPAGSMITRLLRDTGGFVTHATDISGLRPRLLAVAVLGWIFYGAAAGLFQGGVTTVLASMKAPLIVAGAWLICLPSLYVFTTLAGAVYEHTDFWTVVPCTVAIQSLLLCALLPITWLFSVSSKSLLFVVLLHAAVWFVALLFTHRALSQMLPRSVAAPVFLWTILLFVVSLQMATALRPVLWWESGDPLFAREKMSFTQHLGEVSRQDSENP